jgi:hypothetical protein
MKTVGGLQFTITSNGNNDTGDNILLASVNNIGETIIQLLYTNNISFPTPQREHEVKN